MFADNNQISGHQMIRLLILDVFTSAVLILPGLLAKVAGTGGWLAFLLGVLLTLVNGLLLCAGMAHAPGGYFKEIHRRWLRIGIQWLYGIRCLMTFIFLMALFSAVLKTSLLNTMPSWLIIAGMLAVLLYGAGKGIEVRARLAEILFYLLLVPVILIGCFSIPEGNPVNLILMGDVTVEGILKGAAATWVFFAPVEWILYLEPSSTNKNMPRNFYAALGIGSGLVLIMEVFCTCVLSPEYMKIDPWPVLSLMQIVRIPGGFMSRQDGLMLSFWIFAMYISLSGALSHALHLFKIRSGPVSRISLWVTGSFGSACAGWIGTNRIWFKNYIAFMLLSGIVLMWFLPWVIRRRKKVCATMTALIMAVFLSGCDYYTELENRAFVMAMGIDPGESRTFRCSYSFPDLKEITGNGESEKPAVISIEGNSLKECQETYDRMSDKSLDYGQIKVIIFGNKLYAQPELMARLLNEMKDDPRMARTIIVCQSKEEAGAVIELDEKTEGSIGLYIDDLFRNNGERLGTPAVILNDLLGNGDPATAQKKVPVIEIRSDRPWLGCQDRIEETG